MKEYECVQVNHHKKVGEVIEEWQAEGWHLHTYQAVSKSYLAGEVTHYLLFESD